MKAVLDIQPNVETDRISYECVDCGEITWLTPAGGELNCDDDCPAKSKPMGERDFTIKHYALVREGTLSEFYLVSDPKNPEDAHPGEWETSS